MSKVNNPYNCDRQSKYDFTASTVNYMEQKYSNKDIELVFKEFDNKGNLVDFDSNESDIESQSDIAMLYNGILYVIELKERLGKYNSTYYGKVNDVEGWFLNKEKLKSLLSHNAIPLYVNVYPDGKIRIWNLNNINEYQSITKNIHKKTVEESPLLQQDRFMVWNKDSKEIDRIKGYPSKGTWNNKRG